MLKKNKQLIIGFILGALLFTIIPANAKVQDYLLQKSSAKITIDGEEVTNKELPILYYKGYNYIPAATFREICDKIGVGFEWVGEKKEILIKTNKTQTMTEEGSKLMLETPRREKDDLYILVDDGIKYVRLKDIYDKYDGQYNFNPTKDSSINNRKMILVNDVTGEELLNIPHQQTFIFNNQTYLSYDYFVNTVLPIIDKEGS